MARVTLGYMVGFGNLVPFFFTRRLSRTNIFTRSSPRALSEHTHCSPHPSPSVAIGVSCPVPGPISISFLPWLSVHPGLSLVPFPFPSSRGYQCILPCTWSHFHFLPSMAIGASWPAPGPISVSFLPWLLVHPALRPVPFPFPSVLLVVTLSLNR